MSINSSIQQMAGGVAAVLPVPIVEQKSKGSPLNITIRWVYIIIVVISIISITAVVQGR